MDVELWCGLSGLDIVVKPRGWVRDKWSWRLNCGCIWLIYNWGWNPPNPRDRSFFIWDVIGFAWQKPQEVNKFGVHAYKTNPVIVRLIIVALRHMLLIIGNLLLK
jgi:hypothetical protein